MIVCRPGKEIPVDDLINDLNEKIYTRKNTALNVKVRNIIGMKQAEYDIITHDSNTLYVTYDDYIIRLLEDATDPFEDGSLVTKLMLNGDSTDLLGNNDFSSVDIVYESGYLHDCAIFDKDTVKLYYTFGTWSNNEWAFSVWINPTIIDTAEIRTVLDIQGINQGRFIISLSETTNPNTNINIFHGGDWHDTGIAAQVGIWQHLVFTSDGTNFKLFLDNSEIYTAAATSERPDRNTAIGTNYATSDYYYLGKIDQVEFYNRGLTNDEIRALYYTEEFQ